MVTFPLLPFGIFFFNFFETSFFKKSSGVGFAVSVIRVRVRVTDVVELNAVQLRVTRHELPNHLAKRRSHARVSRL